MSYYYIHKYLPSENQELIDGPRIVEMQNDKISFQENEVEGPYISIKELKKESKIFRELVIQNPKRSEKILKEEYIVKVKEIIMFPVGVNEDFRLKIYRIMQHSKNGKVNRSGVSGIHLFNPDKIKLLEILKIDQGTGIFEAEIEVLNERTGKFIKKQGKSSFFPTNWGLQTLILECYSAYINKKKIDQFTYQGTSSSGIDIEFVYDTNGTFKSVYPIFKK